MSENWLTNQNVQKGKLQWGIGLLPLSIGLDTYQ